MRLIASGDRRPAASNGPPRTPQGITRRRFVQGAASGAALAGIGLWRWPAVAIGSAAFRLQCSSGDNFKLTVEEVPVNFTGQAATATAVNGLVPGPMLRLREGDDGDDRRDQPAGRQPVRSIGMGCGFRRGHGRRAGTQLCGNRAGRDFRLPHSRCGNTAPTGITAHSGFQEQTGLYGPLIIEPKGADPIGYDREYVVMLSDWTDQDPEVIFSNLKQQSDYYNYHQRTARTFIRDTQNNGLDATVADRLAWGRMNMAPTDILDVSGAAYTYLLNGHPPGANWTGLVPARRKGAAALHQRLVDEHLRRAHPQSQDGRGADRRQRR